MKKYVKPELFLEEFELSQSVAACGWDMNTMSKESCQAVGGDLIPGSQNKYFYQPADVKIFIESNGGCNVWHGHDDGNIFEYCYEVPTAEETFRIFRS